MSARTRTLTTPELQDGMIVLSNGMRIRISGKQLTAHADGKTFAFTGEVLNAAEVTTPQPGYVLPRVPEHMLVQWKDGSPLPGHWWTVQGNDLATWTVEHSPVYTELEWDGIDHMDYPDYCDAYVVRGLIDGREMTEDELEELCMSDEKNDLLMSHLF